VSVLFIKVFPSKDKSLIIKSSSSILKNPVSPITKRLALLLELSLKYKTVLGAASISTAFKE
jgi:hypothetical protein